VWPAVAVGGVGVGLALVQRRLRGGASDVASWGGVQAEIEKGRPLLIFLFSDSCGACLATRPLVDGIERDLAGTLGVLRVNVAEDVGREARERFGAKRVPTVIVLDASGVERYRTEGRRPRKRAILDALASRQPGVGGGP
jgi:thiol-disulfide isomerase/thioredoxin